MVLVRRRGEPKWHAPSLSHYNAEDEIQALIAESLDVLPGFDDAPMTTVREFRIPGAGIVDVVGVDTNGNIALVECKLKGNPEARREVIGQIMAYASGLWGISYEQFDRLFYAMTDCSLAESTADLSIDTWNEESFRSAIARNLSQGYFKLVVAIDEITDELKKIILYLNEQTPHSQVLALEVGYAFQEDIEVLVPTIYGADSLERDPSLSQTEVDQVVQSLRRLIVASNQGYRVYSSKTFWRMFGYRRRTNERVQDVLASLMRHGVVAHVPGARLGFEELNQRITFRLSSPDASGS